MDAAQPFFLSSGNQRLYALYCAPAVSASDRGDVLYIHPFAEELNSVRRLVAIQAALLSEMGFGVLLFDFYGCGDSAGNFEDARWTIWKANVETAIDWLRALGARPLRIWALRLGAILAMDIAADERHAFDDIILWQPVINGSEMMRQFLRTHVAAAGIADSEPQSADQLRQRLTSGFPVEVAVENANLLSFRPRNSCPIHWIDVRHPSYITNSTRTTQQAVDTWRKSGLNVFYHEVEAMPYWQQRRRLAQARGLFTTMSEILR
jgi:exosortase A-associated hydrolase 2